MFFALGSVCLFGGCLFVFVLRSFFGGRVGGGGGVGGVSLFARLPACLFAFHSDR